VAVLCNGAGFNATQLAEQLADSVIGPRASRPRGAGGLTRPVARAAARPAVPASAFARLAGTYASTEVGGEPFVVTLEDGALVLRQAPATRFVLRAANGATFQASGQVLWFDLDGDGPASTLHIASDRAWDVAFPRIR
jgi:hypothetical protein